MGGSRSLAIYLSIYLNKKIATTQSLQSLHGANSTKTQQHCMFSVSSQIRIQNKTRTHAYTWSSSSSSSSSSSMRFYGMTFVRTSPNSASSPTTHRLFSKSMTKVLSEALWCMPCLSSKTSQWRQWWKKLMSKLVAKTKVLQAKWCHIWLGKSWCHHRFSA